MMWRRRRRRGRSADGRLTTSDKVGTAYDGRSVSDDEQLAGHEDAKEDQGHVAKIPSTSKYVER